VKWKPLRIWDWRLKLVYVLVAYGVGWTFAPLAVLIHDLGILVSVYQLAAILFGARIFRGSNEQVDPPRASWRMTSRPTLSRRLGILATVFGALGAVDIPLLYLARLVPSTHPVRPLTPWDGIGLGIAALQLAVIAYLYFRSARRLGWREAPAPKIARPISLEK
jgi:hypothetical protein